MHSKIKCWLDTYCTGEITDVATVKDDYSDDKYWQFTSKIQDGFAVFILKYGKNQENVKLIVVDCINQTIKRQNFTNTE